MSEPFVCSGPQARFFVGPDRVDVGRRERLLSGIIAAGIAGESPGFHLIAVDPTALSSNPKCLIRGLRDVADEIVGDAVGVGVAVSKGHELISVVAIQLKLGSNPDHPLSILYDRMDCRMGQALVHR